MTEKNFEQIKAKFQGHQSGLTESLLGNDHININNEVIKIYNKLPQNLNNEEKIVNANLLYLLNNPKVDISTFLNYYYTTHGIDFIFPNKDNYQLIFQPELLEQQQQNHPGGAGEQWVQHDQGANPHQMQQYQQMQQQQKQKNIQALKNLGKKHGIEDKVIENFINQNADLSDIIKFLQGQVTDNLWKRVQPTLLNAGYFDQEKQQPLENQFQQMQIQPKQKTQVLDIDQLTESQRLAKILCDYVKNDIPEQGWSYFSTIKSKITNPQEFIEYLQNHEGGGIYVDFAQKQLLPQVQQAPQQMQETMMQQQQAPQQMQQTMIQQQQPVQHQHPKIDTSQLRDIYEKNFTNIPGWINAAKDILNGKFQYDPDKNFLYEFYYKGWKEHPNYNQHINTLKHNLLAYCQEHLDLQKRVELEAWNNTDNIYKCFKNGKSLSGELLDFLNSSDLPE